MRPKTNSHSQSFKSIDHLKEVLGMELQDLASQDMSWRGTVGLSDEKLDDAELTNLVIE